MNFQCVTIQKKAIEQCVYTSSGTVYHTLQGLSRFNKSIDKNLDCDQLRRGNF